MTETSQPLEQHSACFFCGNVVSLSSIKILFYACAPKAATNNERNYKLSEHTNGIWWIGSPGSGLDGHPNIIATVKSQFSGTCAKAGGPVLDISAVAGRQFFPPLSIKSMTAPPQTLVSGSLTHNALPAARVFLKGKVDTQ